MRNDSDQKRKRFFSLILGLCGVGVWLSGCANDPLTQQGRIADLQNDKNAVINERDALRNRYNDLENANRKVTLELAASQQKYQILQDEMLVLKKQLKDTAEQLTTITQEKAVATRRVEELSKLVERQEGVPIPSNTSLAANVETPVIPGTVVRQENGRIHIELPGDKLFEADGRNFSPQGMDLLRNVARSVSMQFPASSISIEGHASAFRQTSAQFRSPMDQSTGQATMVYEVLTRENLVPADQLSVTGCGTSRPLVSGGTEQGASRNYRVELVVQP
ncbi:MAG: OmpA family protein [Planctomycetia bacterium]|nr:OmpA family protein [Planctomycetia bacterium]